MLVERTKQGYRYTAFKPVRFLSENCPSLDINRNHDTLSMISGEAWTNSSVIKGNVLLTAKSAHSLYYSHNLQVFLEVYFAAKSVDTIIILEMNVTPYS